MQVAQSFDLDETRRIVLDGLRGHRAKVYLFGSWARGENRRTSDIDVAVLPSAPLPPGVLSAIREALEDSRIVYRVDLVDLSAASPEFREKALKEGVPWSA
jgi:predicted nucleotidyltransferase